MIIKNAVSTVDELQEQIEHATYETEHHLHNWESWFGAATAPSGEIHVADRIGDTTNYFEVDGGNDTWGAWVQISGSSDTPARTGMTEFDSHKLKIVDAERGTSIHFIQIGIDASGADALSNGNFTEFVYEPQSGKLDETPINILVKRKAVGTKVWARVWVVGQNTGYVRFFNGIHEYAR